MSLFRYKNNTQPGKYRDVPVNTREQAGRSILELSYSGYWEAMKHPAREFAPLPEFAQALLGRCFPIVSKIEAQKEQSRRLRSNTTKSIFLRRWFSRCRIFSVLLNGAYWIQKIVCICSSLYDWRGDRVSPSLLNFVRSFPIECEKKERSERWKSDQKCLTTRRPCPLLCVEEMDEKIDRKRLIRRWSIEPMVDRIRYQKKAKKEEEKKESEKKREKREKSPRPLRGRGGGGGKNRMEISIFTSNRMGNWGKFRPGSTISIDSIRVEFHALTRVTAYKLRFDR